jgi:hypothetical protein
MLFLKRPQFALKRCIFNTRKRWRHEIAACAHVLLRRPFAQMSVRLAEKLGIPHDRLIYARDLLSRCQAELALQICISRFSETEVATEDDVHQMQRLKEGISRCEHLQAHPDLLHTAKALYTRLMCELEISVAVAGVPRVKLPFTTGEAEPAGYWEVRCCYRCTHCAPTSTPLQAQDCGHLQENEGLPLPPAEAGRYVWIPSQSLQSLSASIERITAALVSTSTGAQARFD